MHINGGLPQVSQWQSLVVAPLVPEKINGHYEAALIGFNRDRYDPFHDMKEIAERDMDAGIMAEHPDGPVKSRKPSINGNCAPPAGALGNHATFGFGVGVAGFAGWELASAVGVAADKSPGSAALTGKLIRTHNMSAAMNVRKVLLCELMASSLAERRPLQAAARYRRCGSVLGTSTTLEQWEQLAEVPVLFDT